MAKEGAHTVVADINLDGAEEITRSIQEAGGEAVAVHLDLADNDSIRAAVLAAISTYGRLDVLHNNAASHLAARFVLPSLEADPDIRQGLCRHHRRAPGPLRGAGRPARAGRTGGDQAGADPAHDPGEGRPGPQSQESRLPRRPATEVRPAGMRGAACSGMQYQSPQKEPHRGDAHRALAA